MTSRWLQILALLLAGLLLAASARVSYVAHDQFTEHELRLGGKFSSSVPPSMVLMTTALGTFRGLFIDYLWHRATQLQDDGQFFEANTLAQAITTLMPAAPAVWEFQAWNMAYNISVATHTPEERWEWVRRGIDLLRDRGIPANPQAILLYRELSWIFLHKIGGRSDDMHWYYRIQLAREWQQLLGYVPSQQTTAQTLDSMRAIANAPPTLDALRASPPPQLDAVLARLAQWQYSPDSALVAATGRALMLSSSLQTRMAANPSTSDYDPRLLQLLADSRLGPAFSALLNTLRHQILVSQYHMDPAYMLSLMAPEDQGGQGYGPIDWRLCSAHALYWSQLGSDRSPPVTTLDEIDLLNDRRQVIHALQDMAHFGRIRFDPASNSYHLMPDVRFFPAYEKAYERMKALLRDTPDNQGALTVYDQGHENLLLDAAQTEYFYGDRDRAQQYFQKARRLYANAWWNGGDRSTKYALGLDDFLTIELRDQVRNRSMQAAAALIDGLLYQAFTDGLAGGQPAVFDRFISVARVVHGDFQKRAADAPTPLAPQQRMQFLPFDALVQQTFANFLTDNSLDMVLRATAWRAAPASLRAAVYAAAGPTLQQQAQAAGYDPAKTFPAPPGAASPQPETSAMGQSGPPPSNLQPQTSPSPVDLVERR